MTNPRWLDWAQRLQMIAQDGLSYDPRPFDKVRFDQVREIAAEIMAAYGGDDFEAIRSLLNGEVGHATPKVDSRGVVFRGDEILLVQEKADNNRWTLPGGWVDINEPPSLAVEREVWEESGYRVRATKLLALYDRNKHDHPPHIYHIYKVFFLCELLSDERAEGDNLETASVGFFKRDAIPELSIGRVTPAQIERFFEHRSHPEWPTDFD
ncbi:MAG: NUDIX hydrolase [Anaerolineae bacterium]|nr:NUDIX hydrolase [Anaerolineae bacterium]